MGNSRSQVSALLKSEVSWRCGLAHYNSCSDPVRTGPDVVQGKTQPDNCLQEPSGVHRNVLKK